MGAWAYRGCPLRDAPFSWYEVLTGRVSGRAARQRGGTTTFYKKITHLGYAAGALPDYYQVKDEPGPPLLPPSKERRSGLLLAPIHRTS